ncbi:MAG: 2-oxo acid dehydrogenase subunit E2 [Verrucomicrobia bacterium]|nr:2-oxo acid dehydrogenase subunit E2 [Verrucomicrobiota bacterium]MBU1909504.1 2-oxo acid dehydrogenase subunit E2 [Verrucomicrobiota bacterium]
MPVPFKLPELGENIKGGTIVKVLVKVGDVVTKEQLVLEMETDKAVVEVPSDAAGKITEVYVKDGDKVEIGQLIFSLEGGETAAPAAPPARKPLEQKAPEPVKASQSPEPPPAPTPAAPGHISVAAAPSVRKFAREIGIEIQQVPGRGDGGRITIEDVKRFAKELNTARPQGAAAGPGPAAPPLPDFSRWGEVEIQPMNAVRRKTAEHMSLAWSQIPHVTQFDLADITDLEERRKKLADRAEKAGVKLTVTAMLIKTVAAALKVFPKFNASLNVAGGEVVLKKFYHVGVAVDTERGLLVPVVRDADKKNILQIAAELSRLAEKARSGKIGLEELQGGTFTITNLGGIGGTHFTPIVNYPEVAILGIGRARREPAFADKDGCCKPRLRLPLSLSYDHRLIDGADGARFLRWIVEAIEEPLLIPLEG